MVGIFVLFFAFLSNIVMSFTLLFYWLLFVYLLLTVNVFGTIETSTIAFASSWVRKFVLVLSSNEIENYHCMPKKQIPTKNIYVSCLSSWSRADYFVHQKNRTKCISYAKLKLLFCFSRFSLTLLHLIVRTFFSKVKFPVPDWRIVHRNSWMLSFLTIIHNI